MVIGAAWNGARAFTATSGPGISLMQEFLGLAYFAEIPAVIFDVQRAGPSTGMPTRTQQTDILSCAYASHGDTKHVLLFPEDPAECFEFGATAFDLADRLQTPVFVMLDLDIGMNHRLSRPLAWDDSRKFDRGKVMTAAELEAGKDFGRYLDVDGDGIPYRTYPGTHPTKGSFFTRGTSRDRYARYTEEGGGLRRQHAAPAAQVRDREGPRAAPAAGAMRKSRPNTASSISARPRRRWTRRCDLLEASGHRARPAAHARLPVPFQRDELHRRARFIFIVEQNRDAQLRSLIVNECDVDPVRLIPILHYDGTPITARFIARADRRASRRRSRVTPLRKVGADDLSRQTQIPPPDLPKNELGYTHRDYEGAVSTLCAGCGHDSISAAIIGGVLRTRLPPHRVAKLSGIGCSSKTPTYFLGDSHGFNSRARPHAVGADRRQSRQPRPHLSRRLRRRRSRLDRLRPVRARHPPRRQHGLYRREQRRLRPHQGPVLRHRRLWLEIEARRRQHRQRRSISSRMALSSARPSSRARSPATRRSSCRSSRPRSSTRAPPSST